MIVSFRLLDSASPVSIQYDISAIAGSQHFHVKPQLRQAIASGMHSIIESWHLRAILCTLLGKFLRHLLCGRDGTSGSILQAWDQQKDLLDQC